VVTRDPERNVVLSSRNLEKVGTLPVSLINAAELLRRDTIIMTVDAVRRAEELWSVEKPRRKVKVGQA
jgi:ribosomal protein L4